MVGLTTWAVDVPPDKVAALEIELRAAPGVMQVARFGTVLHMSGTDAAALAALVASRRGEAWSEVKGGLEEAFIYLMSQSKDNFAGAAG